VEALVDYGMVLAAFDDPRAADAFARARHAAEAKGSAVLVGYTQQAAPVAPAV
jgi:hypothetical protein